MHASSSLPITARHVALPRVIATASFRGLKQPKPATKRVCRLSADVNFRGCLFGTLQLLHGSNVAGLDVVLILGNTVLELVDRDLVVLNDKVDLELADTVTNGHKLGGTPDKTILLDGAEVGLELLHVGLVICKSG